MSLEKELKEIKSALEELKSRPLSVTRAGLYIMTFLAMGYSCTAKKDAHDTLELLEKEKPLLVEKNVLGGAAPETFYEINGQRVYLKIDGKPVEQYCNK